MRRFLLVAVSGMGVLYAVGQTSESTSPTPQRLRISEVVAASLVIEKTPVKYPDDARKAAIQGTVTLRVIVSVTGEVKEAAVISGDPVLAQAAADAVKQWKYKPYLVDGVPVEMETQVRVDFQVTRPAKAPPPSLGTFEGQTYVNDFFDLAYPLSRDWVRETQAVRGQLSARGDSGKTYVLLAAVHIPQQTAPLEADSAFVLAALDVDAHNCEDYLRSVADGFQSRKEAKLKGIPAPATIAGRSFYRADFEFELSPSHRTILCSQSKPYLLQWMIQGLSGSAVESVVSSLNAVRSAPTPTSTPRHSEPNAKPSSSSSPTNPEMIRAMVAPSITKGLLIKKVLPVYPEQARQARIEGPVLLGAVINKNGDITDLEVLSGPIELAVSAVNAVRQWKYQPYSVNGEAVEVATQIQVTYQLSH